MKHSFIATLLLLCACVGNNVRTPLNQTVDAVFKSEEGTRYTLKTDSTFSINFNTYCGLLGGGNYTVLNDTIYTYRQLKFESWYDDDTTWSVTVINDTLDKWIWYEDSMVNAEYKYSIHRVYEKNKDSLK